MDEIIRVNIYYVLTVCRALSHPKCFIYSFLPSIPHPASGPGEKLGSESLGLSSEHTGLTTTM